MRPADRAGEAQTSTEDGDERFRIRRFDADRTDDALTWAEAIECRPSERQLLWIDVDGDLAPDEIEALADAFELADRTKGTLEAMGDRPLVAVHGGYFHLRLGTEPDPERPDKVTWLDVIAGENLVITHHVGAIRFLVDHDDRIEADTTIGLIDAPSFVVSLLESSLTSYFAAVDALEDEVDRLDARTLGRGHGRDPLDDLVTLRRRAARLRRVLSDHRDLFASIGTPEFAHAAKGDDAAALQLVATRFSEALSAAEDARDAIRGSFDVYMTRTAQHTNDVVKLLTVATVLLLPGTLITGLMGMNMPIPLSSESPWSFWLVVTGIVALAVVLVSVARWRHWV